MLNNIEQIKVWSFSSRISYVLFFLGLVQLVLPYSKLIAEEGEVASDYEISTFMFPVTDSPDMDAIIPSLSRQISFSQDRLDRGKYLFKIARCNSCHNRSSFSEDIKPNDFGGALSLKFTKNYSDVDLVRAIRSSIDSNGEVFDRSRHKGFFWMTDKDVYSIVYYLRTLISYDTKTSFSDHYESEWYKVGHIPEVNRSSSLEYGKYLTQNISQCTMCHSAESGLFTRGNRLGGDEVETLDGAIIITPDISSSSKVGNWGFDDFALFLISKKKNCPTDAWQHLKVSDVDAIHTYLNSVKNFLEE